MFGYLFPSDWVSQSLQEVMPSTHGLAMPPSVDLGNFWLT